MLGKLYTTHKDVQAGVGEKLDSQKKETLGNMGGVTNLFTEFLTKDANEVYITQKELEKGSKLLLTEGRRLAENTARWIDTVERLNKSLNEIGDIENWASVMERDFFVVAKTLENVYSLPPTTSPSL